MKTGLISVTVAALVATAACNRGEDQPASAPQGGTAVVAQNGNPGGGGAQTATSDPKAAYDARHEGFEAMGRSFKALNRELKGDTPDLDVVRREAASLAETAPRIPGWFPAGSGQDAVSRSRAKDAVWTDNADFQQRAQNFVQATTAFRQTAQGGDVAAIQAALPNLGNSCKECHDRYRQAER